MEEKPLLTPDESAEVERKKFIADFEAETGEKWTPETEREEFHAIAKPDRLKQPTVHSIAAARFANLKALGQFEPLRRCNATKPQIESAVSMVYLLAEESGKKPPNIVEARNLVIEILARDGLWASGAQIQRIAGQIKGVRLPRGRRPKTTTVISS
jgi:hypothetical protein